MLSFAKIIMILTLLLINSGCSFFKYQPKHELTSNKIVINDTTYYKLHEDRYCIIGEERKLRRRNIIHRIRGLTRQYVINPHIILNENHAIDPHTLDSILISGYCIKVLGLIPNTSYKIDELSDNDHLIVILDKMLFWKNSKVSVITYREY